jgi:cobyrinic acid a,c-diamide synthase
MTARGLIVAATRSGSGKTTITLALLAALKRRGIAVRAAKVGPDYIDPAFHAAATGAPSVNLDSWAMPPALLDALAADAAGSAQILIVEGVMGLFDGVPGAPGRTGASADIAARFGLPVLLMLDVSGQSQTAAAVARGLATHDPDVRIAGVVLNRVGSERHRALVADAIASIGVPVLGAVPRDAALAMPERHLGLVQANEHADLAARFDCLAAMAERHLDLDRIAAMAAPLNFQALCGTAGLSLPGWTGQTPVPGACSRHSGAPQSGEPGIHNHDGLGLWIPGSRPPAEPRNDGACHLALPPPGQRIALAADAAFTFVYPHVLDGWRRTGAEIVAFSPLADEPPPESCDACWLPGGYPELHAGALANANRFRDGLRRFAATRPVHGECGGYMVLSEGLEDAHGARHAMAGLLGHAASFAKRKLHLGYREARLLCDNPLGAAGEIIRGHEFHYATVIASGTDERFLALTDAQGRPVGNAGGRRGSVTGTFFHAIARG